MNSYAFEFSVQRGDRESSEVWSDRVYRDDGRAVAAARRMFAGRTQDANDELMIYEGRKNGWGCVEGHNGGDPRYVGKIAYGALGNGYQFFKA